MITMPAQSWTDFKNLVTTKKLIPQYSDTIHSYEIYATEGIYVWTIGLPKGSSDATDFENNYQANYNKPVETVDSDNAKIIRAKAAQAGWTYHLTSPEFETSVVGSLYHKDVSGNDLGEATLKFYDSNLNELTTQGSCDTDCVETHLIFEPSWDYEIIGGTIKSISTVTENVRVWVIAVPDIPAGSGGSKVMVQGINLKFIDSNNGVKADGRVAKYMTYNATYHTNKLKLVIKHPAGYKEKLTIMFELFRQ